MLVHLTKEADFINFYDYFLHMTSDIKQTKTANRYVVYVVGV